MDDIDYKQLWYDICEEKKQLQLENHILKTNLEYSQREAEKFERMVHSKQTN